jgi:hypothetical protein
MSCGVTAFPQIVLSALVANFDHFRDVDIEDCQKWQRVTGAI